VMCGQSVTAELVIDTVPWNCIKYRTVCVLCLLQADARYETTTSVKAQMKFLEELDSLERKRHEEVQRGVLLRAAKVHGSHSLSSVFLHRLHPEDRPLVWCLSVLSLFVVCLLWQQRQHM